MVKLLKYCAVFAAIYIPLVVFTMPFFISWGSKRNALEKIYLLFIGSPFDYSTSLWLILANSLFWFAVLFVVVLFVKAIYKRLHAAQ